jgi:hypothetical protein
MTPTETALVAALIPFLTALTAWIRAETANRKLRAHLRRNKGA